MSPTKPPRRHASATAAQAAPHCAAAPTQDECFAVAQTLVELGYIRWDRRCLALFVSDKVRTLLARVPSAPLQIEELQACVTHAELARLQGLLRAAVASRSGKLEAEFAVSCDDGTQRQIRALAMLSYAADGQAASCLVGLQDISAQQVTLLALSQSKAQLEEAQSIAQLAYWEWDFKLNQAKFSKEALLMLHRPADWNPTIQDLQELVPPDQREWVMSLYAEAFSKRQTTLRYEVLHEDPDGTAWDIHTLARIDYNSRGNPRRLLATIQNISELKSYRRQLHTLSFFDPLTDLPNRAQFVDLLRQGLIEAARHKQQVGVMMLDLDRFKDINDSLGHAAGDDLLKQSAQRLQQALRGYDTVARLGGDEFAVMLPELRHATDMGGIAHKVLGAFSAPFSVAGEDVFVTASIGGALYPVDAQDVGPLLQYADAALYHAKAKGRNNFQLYSKELTAQAAQRLTLESELRKGIERQELALFYQPKFELSTQRLVGAEALMRWIHPQRGLVSPDSFIPLAEDTGLIVQMGAWALHAACVAVAGWNAGRRSPLKVAVNLSVKQFADTNFVTTVRDALDATGCQAEWLELEITESLLLDGRDEVVRILDALTGMGITIAIDDFGIGYSALSYLTRLPVQTLKIDRSFVKGLPLDKSSAELVKAIASLGRSLNMVLVAEGVETTAQAQHLIGLGCELVQGYLYGKPVPIDVFNQLVEDDADGTAQ